MEQAQAIVDIIRKLIQFISVNWDIFGLLLSYLVAKGYISNKNGEAIGKMFDREMGAASLDLQVALDSVSKENAKDKLPEIAGIVDDVVAKVAANTPLDGSSVKDKAEMFAKEIILHKLGMRDSASLDISKEVKLAYKDGMPQVVVKGFSNKVGYKAKKFLKKVF